MKKVKAIVMFFVMAVALIATPAYAKPGLVDKAKQGIEVGKEKVEVARDAYDVATGEKSISDYFPEYISGHSKYWPSVLFGRSIPGMIAFCCVFLFLLVATPLDTKKKRWLFFSLLIWPLVARIVSGGFEWALWPYNTPWLLLFLLLIPVLVIWKRKWFSDLWYAFRTHVARKFLFEGEMPWLQGITRQPALATAEAGGGTSTISTTSEKKRVELKLVPIRRLKDKDELEKFTMNPIL
jgi:ABC-type sugar transport system permease subunit